MKLYLDDDSAAHVLVRLLRQAGHEVETPTEAGLAGSDDPIHLMHAIDVDRVFLTMNHADFRNPHNLVIRVQGHHLGILVIRKDNDRRRDLPLHGIVQAIANLDASGVELPGGFFILNQWR